jgi:hypothetical protein
MKNLFRQSLRWMLVLAFGSLAAFPAFAQQSMWSVDAQHSTARIFLADNANLQNVGIALVRGAAKFNSADPTQSALTFSAELPGGQSISFRSESVGVDFDGNLHIAGKMTLAHMERGVTVDPREDYSGALYGEPAIYKATREVSFVLPMADAVEKNAKITAEAELGIESFPRMFAAVRQANWQPVVEDEHCELAQAGEDYRGAVCSGRVLAPAYNIAAVNVGEDYRGFDSRMPSGKLMKLVLQLNLNREAIG